MLSQNVELGTWDGGQKEWAYLERWFLYKKKLKMFKFFSSEKSPDIVNSSNLYIRDNSSFEYRTLDKSALIKWGVGMEVEKNGHI